MYLIYTHIMYHHTNGPVIELFAMKDINTVIFIAEID